MVVDVEVVVVFDVEDVVAFVVVTVVVIVVVVVLVVDDVLVVLDVVVDVVVVVMPQADRQAHKVYKGVEDVVVTVRTMSTVIFERFVAFTRSTAGFVVVVVVADTQRGANNS